VSEEWDSSSTSKGARNKKSLFVTFFIFETKTIMKTFTINAIIDKIIDGLNITRSKIFYLTTIFGDWIVSASSGKRLQRWAYH
jgi:hypothetical protein